MVIQGKETQLTRICTQQEDPEKNKEMQNVFYLVPIIHPEFCVYVLSRASNKFYVNKFKILAIFIF